jgi:hypothetical protein
VKLYIHVEGGVIQGIYTDGDPLEIRAYVMDSDVDDYDRSPVSAEWVLPLEAMDEEQKSMIAGYFEARRV